MRIVVTGGTGLIGRALTENLIDDGHEVIALSRAPERREPLPSGARLVRWDGRTGDGWVEHAERADAIVNLAGVSLVGDTFIPQRWTSERKRLILESRLLAGRAVIDAVERTATKPHCIIQSSGIGYYGDVSDHVVEEGSPPGGDFLARVAVEWESAIASAEALGVRRAIIRSAGVLARDDGLLPRIALPFRLFVGGQLGDGEQYMPWIHIDDEVRAIRFLIERPEATGPFNLVAPDPITNQEFSTVLGRAMGRPSALRVPGIALRLALGELSSVVLTGQRAVPRRLTEMGFTFRFPDTDAALRDLLR